LNLLEEGIKLVEEDYLGGCGSRGYGRVKFNLRKVIYSYIKDENGIISIEKQELDPENFKSRVFNEKREDG